MEKKLVVIHDSEVPETGQSVFGLIATKLRSAGVPIQTGIFEGAGCGSSGVQAFGLAIEALIVAGASKIELWRESATKTVSLRWELESCNRLAR